jgi:hypothetical protein
MEDFSSLSAAIYPTTKDHVQSMKNSILTAVIPKTTGKEVCKITIS